MKPASPVRRVSGTGAVAIQVARHEAHPRFLGENVGPIPACKQLRRHSDARAQRRANDSSERLPFGGSPNAWRHEIVFQNPFTHTSGRLAIESGTRGATTPIPREPSWIR
jgi:hypothetical protein